MSTGRPLLEILSWIAGIAGTSLAVYAFLIPAPPQKEQPIVVNPPTIVLPPQAPIHVTVQAAEPKPVAVAAESGTSTEPVPLMSQSERSQSMMTQPSIESKGSIQPSFDCKRASTWVEQTLCTDSTLASADVALDAVYVQVMAMKPHLKQTVRVAQRQWIRDARDSCQDKGCLHDAYTKRIQELRALAR